MKRFFKFLKIIIALLLVFICVFFFWASSPNLDETDYAEIIEESVNVLKTDDSIYSIVTYNIGYLSGMTNNKAIEKPKSLFDDNLSQVKKEFQKINVDIIAFQEIDYNSSRSYTINQQNEIAKLGYKYIAKAINWDEKYVPFPYYPISTHFGKIVSGQSILSKYPITEHQRIVLKRDENNWFYRDAFYLDRLLQIVKISLENQQEIIVMNVHLDAYNHEVRKEQLETIIKQFNEYDKEYPVILVGDFNSDPKYPKAVINSLLDDKLLGNAAFLKGNYLPSFNTDKPFERLDYIFYNKSKIEILDSKVLKEFGQASDHFPVYMQFKFK